MSRFREAIRASWRLMHRWSERLIWSALLRVFVFVLPISGSAGTAILLSSTLPIPRSGTDIVLWWLLVTAAAVIALVILERLARRLLPLAMLLQLTMAFPDRAPTRLSVARLATRPSVLSGLLPSGTDDQTKAGATALALVAALSSHDAGTRGHAERVRVFSELLGEELRLSRRGRDRLRWAAVLHDIGKLSIPADLLNKEGEPSREEWSLIKRHPTEGLHLLGSFRHWLGPWTAAISQHHERYDGTGYPSGLAGDDIYLGARIVAVADAFDSITSPRSYRPLLSLPEARRELVACAGSQFDPMVVRAFLNVSLGRLWRAAGPAVWLGSLPMIGLLRHLGREGAMVAGATAVVGALVLGGPLQPLPAPGLFPEGRIAETTPPVVLDPDTADLPPQADSDSTPPIPDPGEPVDDAPAPVKPSGPLAISAPDADPAAESGPLIMGPSPPLTEVPAQPIRPSQPFDPPEEPPAVIPSEPEDRDPEPAPPDEEQDRDDDSDEGHEDDDDHRDERDEGDVDVGDDDTPQAGNGLRRGPPEWLAPPPGNRPPEDPVPPVPPGHDPDWTPPGKRGDH